MNKSGLYQKPKISSMKKVILLFSIGLLFYSCSNDSESQTTIPFFNLNQGNKWAYKLFNSNDNVNYVFSNLIDSVTVSGDSIISGNSFVKLHHHEYLNGTFLNYRLELLRVNSQGHLVNSDGYVLHPGTDAQYQGVREVFVPDGMNNSPVSVGTITSQLQPLLSTTVEGVNYSVYPYYGTFISTHPTIPNNYIFDQYQEGIGLVKQHWSSLSGTSFYEYRLVSYQLQP